MPWRRSGIRSAREALSRCRSICSLQVMRIEPVTFGQRVVQLSPRPRHRAVARNRSPGRVAARRWSDLLRPARRDKPQACRQRITFGDQRLDRMQAASVAMRCRVGLPTAQRTAAMMRPRQPRIGVVGSTWVARLASAAEAGFALAQLAPRRFRQDRRGRIDEASSSMARYSEIGLSLARQRAIKLVELQPLGLQPGGERQPDRCMPVEAAPDLRNQGAAGELGAKPKALKGCSMCWPISEFHGAQGCRRRCSSLGEAEPVPRSDRGGCGCPAATDVV
jgi:hypothetical protein